MAEAAHGTAPSLQGKNVANPMAMILAGAALLAFAGERARPAEPRRSARRRLEAVADGVRTADLGGHAGTTRVHRRGDPPRALEARGLARALTPLPGCRAPR